MFVGMSLQESWHPVFDLWSDSEVVWDVEPQQFYGEMDDPLECNHTMFKAAVVSTNDGQMVFDELASHVVWDEEKQHMIDHPGLLKQLAQGGNDFVGGEEKATAKPSTYGVLTDVSGSCCLLEIDINAVSEFDDIHLEDNHATMSEYVQFMDPVTSNGASHMMLDEMQNLPVVWDDELYGLDCQDAVVQEETQLNKCLNVDNTTVDLVVGELLTHSSDMDTADNLFADTLGVRWDEEMQSDIDTHANLLQQLALSVDDEKTKHTVSLHASVVFTHVDTSPILKQCMDAADSFPNMVMVLDEELFHQLDSHDELLKQMALGGEYWDGEKMICIPLSPGNRGYCPFSDVDSVQLHMTAQIDKVEAILTDVNHVKHALDTTDCQVLGCKFRESVFEIRKTTVAACEMLTAMPCQGHTNQLLAQRRHIFSPREYKQQLQQCMMPERQRDLACRMVLAAVKHNEAYTDMSQWDPGILILVLVRTKPVMILGSFKRYSCQLVVKVPRGISCCRIFVRAIIDLCAGGYQYSADGKSIKCVMVVNLLEHSLQLTIQQHFWVLGNETTVALEATILSLALCVIINCCRTVLEYQAFKCQMLQELYNIKRMKLIMEKISCKHQKSELQKFSTWRMCSCCPGSDDNCMVQLVLEDMVFGVVIIDKLIARKSYFDLFIQGTISTKVFHLIEAMESLLVMLLPIRPWDPGIYQAVAWGQATFCGGGSVTPRNSNVSKAVADKRATDPWDPGGRPDAVYKF